MEYVQPIRDKEKIEAMKKVLKSGNLRDYALFVVGINSGLRISDLLKLKVEDVLGDKGKYRDRIVLREKKTGKEKNFPLGKTVKKSLDEYLSSRKYVAGDWLFPSRQGNKPLSRQQAYNIINSAAKTIGIAEQIGTHTLRKTFGYHAYRQGTDISIIQKLLNHAAPSVTLAYIGITQDQLDDVYLTLEL